MLCPVLQQFESELCDVVRCATATDYDSGIESSLCPLTYIPRLAASFAGASLPLPELQRSLARLHAQAVLRIEHDRVRSNQASSL